MHTNPTIEAYNQYAHNYDEGVTTFWDNFPRTFIMAFVERTPGRRVLDVGSGSGRDAVLLREQGLEVVCLDGSQTMIDMTTRLGFESVLSDFAYIDFPAASFDGIWAYTSLIHIPKAEAQTIIGRLHGLLKPGGSFVMGAIEGESEGMVQHSSMPGAARYFKRYGKEELRQMIEPLGFELVHAEDYQPHNSVYVNQLYIKSS
ncbi:class I SAM-dependent methyltransferase [Candidatus Saccharibacteria bacterium]|nr:class I SAM-dependent methyltransferase [Candidatus Saccharibacteria bacterium]